jgi:hypothetical protein
VRDAESDSDLVRRFVLNTFGATMSKHQYSTSKRIAQSSLVPFLEGSEHGKWKHCGWHGRLILSISQGRWS